MLQHKKIITDIQNGGPNGYTVKEILTAKIQQELIFQDWVRDQFINGSGKIATNTTGRKILYFVIMPIFFSCFGGLFILILKLHNIL